MYISVFLVVAFAIYLFFAVKQAAQRRDEQLKVKMKYLVGCIQEYSSHDITTGYEHDISELKPGEEDAFVRGLERFLIFCMAYPIVRAHSKTLWRKRKQLIYKDDYGREISDRWDAESKYFTESIFLPEMREAIGSYNKYDLRNTRAYSELFVGDDDEGVKIDVDYWVDVVNDIMDQYPEEDSGLMFSSDMNGIDYEHFVANIIESAGWDVMVTPPSGDQGADIIASCGEVRIAVQCKRYTGAVGNGGVQEAHTAMSYYDCAAACVVTNSEFTVSARQLAHKLHVLLIHHEDIFEFFSTFFDDEVEEG